MQTKVVSICCRCRCSGFPSISCCSVSSVLLIVVIGGPVSEREMGGDQFSPFGLLGSPLLAPEALSTFRFPQPSLLLVCRHFFVFLSAANSFFLSNFLSLSFVVTVSYRFKGSHDVLVVHSITTHSYSALRL